MTMVFSELLVDLVDDLDGGFAGGGVQVGKRFVKEQNVHIVDHHAGQGGALLLPAGKLEGGGGQQVLHLHHLRHFSHPVVHLGVGDIIILQGKGDVLAGGQPDKLPVGILQHRADHLGELEDILFSGFQPVDLQAALLDLALVGKRNQAVQAVAEGAFAAAAGTDDEDFFAGVDLQVDVVQGGFSLAVILKGKISEIR